jgi:hypothetical protein
MQVEYFCIIIEPDSSAIFSLANYGDILNRIFKAKYISLLLLSLLCFLLLHLHSQFSRQRGRKAELQVTGMFVPDFTEEWWDS